MTIIHEPGTNNELAIERKINLRTNSMALTQHNAQKWMDKGTKINTKRAFRPESPINKADRMSDESPTKVDRQKDDDTGAVSQGSTSPTKKWGKTRTSMKTTPRDNNTITAGQTTATTKPNIAHKSSLSTRKMRPGKKLRNTAHFGYKTNYQTIDYHLVPGKFGLEKASLTIEVSEHPSKIYRPVFGVERHAPRINRYAVRPSFVDDKKNPNNDNKFEIFDRSPHCLSKNTHQPVLHMAKITRRNIA